MGWTFDELNKQPTYRIQQMMRFIRIEENVRKIKDAQK